MKKYIDFLNENKLQLLLEANLTYTPDFVGLLYEIDTPISNVIKNLENTEVDVKTNHIALDYDKIDYISFIPEDKYEKLPNILDSDTYNNASTSLANDAKANGYAIGNIYYPPSDCKVEVVKDFTEDELEKILGRSISNLYSHIKWDYYDGIRECFYKTKFISKDTSGIKETPFKIGKFVRNLLDKAGAEFTAKDIEAFVDKFKSEMKKKKDIFNTNFKIVQGSDIRKYYLQDNYASDGGTLGSSCMRYYRCQKYLDIYVDNDNVSLVVFFDNEDESKITGRAILWTAIQNSTGEVIKFMDRIYTNKSNDIELFRQYAIKNGFHYKYKQDYSEVPLMFNNNVLSDEDSLITIENVHLDYDDLYPYVDTVKYFCDGDDTLTNDKGAPYEKMLDATNGGRCEGCDGDGTVECSRCEGDGREECGECDGYAEVDCGECDGEGDKDCRNCDGEGEIDCGSCDGDGTDEEGETCSDCDGSGKSECSECSGKGKEDCDSCSNGKVECGRCEGDGKVECYNCDGEGRVDCSECS